MSLKFWNTFKRERFGYDKIRFERNIKRITFFNDNEEISVIDLLKYMLTIKKYDIKLKLIFKMDFCVMCYNKEIGGSIFKLAVLRRPFKADLPIYCWIQDGEIVDFQTEDGLELEREWLRGELERYGELEILELV